MNSNHIILAALLSSIIFSSFGFPQTDQGDIQKKPRTKSEKETESASSKPDAPDSLARKPEVAKNTITGKVIILDARGKEKKDLSNVVVFLEDVGKDIIYKPNGKKQIISQENGDFTPYVLPIIKGSTVHFPNNDYIFHNVFSLSKTKPFDLGIYKYGDSKSVQFPQAGLVKVYCNIHPRMLSYILVLNNPFFAVTDKQGNFVISDVPDGTFTLRTWYESGKDTRTEISISTDNHSDYVLEVQATRRVVQHKNKFGKAYKGKY